MKTQRNKRRKSFSVALVMLLTFVLQILGIGFQNNQNILKAYNQAGDVTNIIKGEATPRIYMHFDKDNGGWLEIDIATTKNSKQDGTVVFCVEPGIKSVGGNHNASQAEGTNLDGKVVYVDGGHLGTKTLSTAMVNELEKIIYYGWEESAKTIDDYSATQVLIWSKVWNGYITNYGNGLNLIKNKINQIENLVKNHGVMPNLSGEGYDPSTNTLSLEAGQTVTLTDSNNVIGKGLGKMKLIRNSSNIKVQVENGKLTITAPETETNGSLTFLKINPTRNIPASLIWFNGHNQKLIDTSDPDGGDFSINFNSKPSRGEIEFRKEGENGELIDGAEFQLQTSEGTVIKNFTTTNGIAKLTDLEPGTYKIVEIKSPKGYVKGSDITVTVTAGGTASASIDNKRQEFTIEVFKQDKDTKNPLAGAKFEVVDPSGKVLTTVTTDKSGKAKTPALKILQDGNYIVREVQAPKGYKSNSQDINININGDSSNVVLEYTADFANEVIKAPIVVQKYDLVKGLDIPKETSLARAKFEIIAKSLDNPANTPYKVGDVVDTLVTNEEGKAKSKDLYLGTYELKEVEAPKGFVLNTETVSFSLTQNGDTAEINQLSENNEKVLADLNKQVEDLNTTWKTKEAKREAETLFELSKPQVEDKTITFADRHILGRIDLNKVLGEYYHKAGDPKKPEADIQFNILDKDGEVVDSIITNKYGYGSSKYLPFGTYTLKQITETEFSYKVEDQEIIIDKDLFNYTYQLENKEVTSRLKLVKLDQETGKQIPQANVSFEIYKKDGTKVVQNIYYPEHKEISLFKTTEDGTVELPEPLVAGEYYIKEVDFPKNYVVEDTRVDFTVSRSIVEETEGILVIDISNKPAYGEIVISKTGDFVKSFNEETVSVSGKEYKVYSPVMDKSYLAGVKFEILAGEDIYSGDGELKHKQGDKISTLETNDKEPVKTDKLYFGKYIIKEIEAPKGYARHTEDFVIELTHKEPTQELISESFSLNNQLQTAKLSVKKHMEESKHFGSYEKALEGVVFALVTKEELQVPNSSLEADRIVGIARPDKDGMVSFEKILPGKYRLVELSTNNAYELAEAEDVEFSPADDNTLETELSLKAITNKLKKYNLEIIKVDAENPNFKLQGAVFALYVKQGDKYVEVDRGITVEGGKLRFEDLNSGNYYLREIEAPSTHVKRPTLYQFSTVNSAETIYTTFENKKTTVEISKVDIAGKEIAGAKLEVFDKDGNVIDSWTSEEGKTHIIRGLRKGETYTLRETLAPAGYVKAQDIEFTVNEDGSTTRVEMINELKPSFTTTGEKVLSQVIGITLLASAMVGFVLQNKQKRKDNQ